MLPPHPPPALTPIKLYEESITLIYTVLAIAGVVLALVLFLVVRVTVRAWQARSRREK